MNSLLVGWLLLATSGAGELPIGTELQYAGTLTPQTKSGAGEAKSFTVNAVALAADDGSTQLAWSLEERGAGGWAWPERFGTLVPGSPENSKARPIRLLHTHDELPHPVAVRSPWFEFQNKLEAEATWNDGRLEYRVARKRKVKDRECWQVEVTSNLGRAQTLLVDAATGILVSADQRIFLGRGDEFQLKMELQSQKTLAASDLSRAQKTFESLRQLQSALNRTGDQKVVELTPVQWKAAQDSIGAIEKGAEGTAWSKLTGIIARDLLQQQRRLEGVAGLEKKFVGQPAPKLILKRADGSAIPEAELQGKVVVLHIWEYRNENLAEPYGQVGYLDFLNTKRKKLGVKVIGVNVDSRFADAEKSGVAGRSMKKLQEFMNLAYDVAIDDGATLSQFGDPRTLGSPLPLWIVIGHDGRVVHYHIGFYDIKPDEGLKLLDEAVIEALRKARSG